MTIEQHLLLFRVILALTAWIAILYDNYKHRDLRLVGYAYTFLVVGTASAFFSFLPQINYANASRYATHIFAILLAGLLFALTAYKAYHNMHAIQQKTINAYKGRKKWTSS